MALVGQLQFTQGANVGPNGEAFIATLAGGAVVCSNTNNALALSWAYQFLDVPIGSALSTSTPFSSGSSPTGSFTPDVAGSYQVMLTVTGVGGTQATDIRTVIVKTANRGWILPAYEDTNLTVNYPNPSTPNAVGWKDALNKIFVDIDANGFSGGGVTWANDLAGSTNTTQKVVSLTGSGGTLAMAATAAALAWAAGTVSPTLYQVAPSGTGTTNGQTLTIQTQRGQNQTGVNANNNGGSLYLATGGAGTGGSGAAGLPGSIYLALGATQVALFGGASTDFIKLGAPTATGSAYASTGLIRFGDGQSVAVAWMVARNTTNTADWNLISTDGFGDLYFGNNGWSQIIIGHSGATSATLACAAGSFQANGAITSLISYVIPAFKTQSVVGAFTFDSVDASLTGWNYGINGTAIGGWTASAWTFATGVTSPSIKQANNVTNSATATSLTLQAQNATGTTSVGGDLYLTSGSGTSTNGTTHLQVAGADIATATTAKFTTKKGLNRAVTRGATSLTLTTSNDVYIFSASGQTATLPSSPSVGDKYTVGLDAAGASNTYGITGAANSIIYNGVAYTTITVTTSSSSPNAFTVMWNGSFWVCTPGF